MTVSVFRAIHTNAPVLNGTLGSLLNLIRTCLVTGYTSHPAAGWSEASVVGNIGMFINTDGACLVVDDDQVATPKKANVYGFESGTTIASGVNKFPTGSQVSSALWVQKSNAASTAPRDWILVATSKIFYLIINAQNEPGFPNANGLIFGTFTSLRSSDEYNFILVAKSSVSEDVSFETTLGLNCSIGSVNEGHYVARSVTQIGGSRQIGKHGDLQKAGLLYPNPADGGLYLSPVWITEPNILRGKLPGVWYTPHLSSNFIHGDTFSGVGDLSGKQFEILFVKNGIFIVETSDTWS